MRWGFLFPFVQKENTKKGKNTAPQEKLTYFAS